MVKKESKKKNSKIEEDLKKEDIEEEVEENNIDEEDKLEETEEEIKESDEKDEEEKPKKGKEVQEKLYDDSEEIGELKRKRIKKAIWITVLVILIFGLGVLASWQYFDKVYEEKQANFIWKQYSLYNNPAGDKKDSGNSDDLEKYNALPSKNKSTENISLRNISESATSLLCGNGECRWPENDIICPKDCKSNETKQNEVDLEVVGQEEPITCMDRCVGLGEFPYFCLYLCNCGDGFCEFAEYQYNLCPADCAYLYE